MSSPGLNLCAQLSCHVAELTPYVLQASEHYPLLYPNDIRFGCQNTAKQLADPLKNLPLPGKFQHDCQNTTKQLGGSLEEFSSFWTF